MKTFLIKLIFLAGLLLIADGLFLAVTTNVNTGTVLTLLAGAALCICALWHEKITKITEKGILRAARYIVLAGAIFVMCLILFLGYTAHKDSVNYMEDAVIVLGAAVHGDKVSRTLAYRLDKAAEYSAENPEALIIVSGGKGPQEAVTEASAMEQYLIRKGVSAQRIVKEEKATSTFENFKFSKEVLDRCLKDGYSCAYITSDFHLYRAGSIAKQAGIDAEGLGSHTEWYNLPPSYLRESLAVVKFWLLKK